MNPRLCYSSPCLFFFMFPNTCYYILLIVLRGIFLQSSSEEQILSFNRPFLSNSSLRQEKCFQLLLFSTSYLHSLLIIRIIDISMIITSYPPSQHGRHGRHARGIRGQSRGHGHRREPCCGLFTLWLHSHLRRHC